MVDAEKMAADPMFRQIVDSMWREVFVGTSHFYKIPPDFALRVARQAHVIRAESAVRDENIVIEGPLDWTPEQAEHELTLVGLVILRDVRALYWADRGDYEFQLDGTGDLVGTLLTWYREMPEDALLSLTEETVKDYLLLSGVLTPCLERHLDTVVDYGMTHLINKDLESGS
jgi:hypothetical protein